MKVTPLIRESYFAMIHHSVGSTLFRSFFANVDGEERDILKDGLLSCAAYVSWVLHHFGLLREPHVTVAGTIKDLEASGWRRIRIPTQGCILVWEAVRFPDGAEHRHIGFYLGGDRAISNSTTTRTPVIHHWTYGRRNGKPRRRVVGMYMHPALTHVAAKKR